MRYIVKFYGGDVFECEIIQINGISHFQHVLNSSYIIRTGDDRIESFRKIDPSCSPAT